MKNLSVRTKIIILILTMGIMGAGVGVFGIYKITESNKNLNKVIEDSFLPFQNLKNASNTFSLTREKLKELSVKNISIEASRTKIESDITSAHNLINIVQPKIHFPAEKKYYQQIQTQINLLIPELNAWLNQLKINREGAVQELPQIIEKYENLNNNLELLMCFQVEKAGMVQKDNRVNLEKSKLYFALILSIGVVISMLLALIILIGIKSNISSTNRLLQKMASGDLSTVIIERGIKDFGELHSSLRQLSEKYIDILELAQSAANSISATSDELSTNALLISNGANDQAASVEEIASSMEQISSRVEKNTYNSRSTETISAKLSTDIGLGTDNVKQTVDAIKEIATKISVIGDIAFQTNILALNAAVEAARAGEHGKGFGVVAAAVGKLADRSKKAASEIDALSKSGVVLAINSRDLLYEFVEELSASTKLISEIIDANLEQNSGISEVNASIQRLNQITQQNASSSEEMASVSDQMAAQAHSLNTSIQYFKFSKQVDNKKQKYLNPFKKGKK